jgi:RES domain-containing protein
MVVYRISVEKWAGSLAASGNAARWNSKGIYVLYTASTRSLACLENVVHRDGLGLSASFRTMLIQVPDDLKITTIPLDSLDENWREWAATSYTRAIGDAWAVRLESAVLRVPSAIIPDEFNYIINTAHPDFGKISLIRTEPFQFDPRIKSV